MDTFLALISGICVLALGFIALQPHPPRLHRAVVAIFVAVGLVGILVQSYQAHRTAVGAEQSARRGKLMLTFMAARGCPGVEWVYENGEPIDVRCPVSGAAPGQASGHGTLTTTPPTTPVGAKP